MIQRERWTSLGHHVLLVSLVETEKFSRHCKRFGLVWKALNPTQSQEQSVIKVGLKLLEQLKNKVNNQMLKTKYLKSIYEYGMLLKLLSFG